MNYDKKEKLQLQKEVADELIHEHNGLIKKLYSNDDKIVGYLLRKEISSNENEAVVAINVSINDMYRSNGKKVNVAFAKMMRTFGIKHLDNDYDVYRFKDVLFFSRSADSDKLDSTAKSFSTWMNERYGCDAGIISKVFKKFILSVKDYYKDTENFKVFLVSNMDDMNILFPNGFKN